MLQNLPPWATLILSGLVFLFTFAIGIYALTAPYMKYSMGNITSDIYFDKECVDGVCQKLVDTNLKDWDATGKALQALYIILVILSAVCFLLYVFNQKRIFNMVSLLLLLIALTTMITLIVVVQTYYVNSKLTGITIANTGMEFTSASILMIIACCFMIVKQIFANDYIRSRLVNIFSMIYKK